MSDPISIKMQPYDPENPPRRGRQILILFRSGSFDAGYLDIENPTTGIVESWGYLP